MFKSKFTEAEKEKIWDLYISGTSVLELQETCGAGETTIRRILKRKGKITDSKYAKPKISHEFDKEITNARRGGEPLEKLASRYGVSVRAIEERLREYGVKPFEHVGKLKDECIRLYLQGLSLSEIGKQLGVTHHYVSHYLDLAGERKKETKDVSELTRQKLARCIPEEIKNQIINLYMDREMSIEELEKQFKCSHSTISRILHRANVDVKKPGTLTSNGGNKIREANTGKKRTTDTRQKMSISMKKAMTPERKKQISGQLQGHPVSQETRDKFSKLIKQRLKNGCSLQVSSIEKEVQCVLDGLLIAYIPQAYIPIKLGERKRGVVADFLINDFIILEVYGTYWHCDPRKYPNGPICEMQRKHSTRDVERTMALEESGYKVLTVWEIDIKKSAKNAVLDVLKEVMPLAYA